MRSHNQQQMNLNYFTTILANQLNHFILPMFPKCIEDVEDLYESIKG